MRSRRGSIRLGAECAGTTIEMPCVGRSPGIAMTRRAEWAAHPVIGRATHQEGPIPRPTCARDTPYTEWLMNRCKE